MIIQQVARTQAYPYKTQKADSAGAWQAPKTLKHGLQRQYDKELVTNIYLQYNNLHWEQTPMGCSSSKLHFFLHGRCGRSSPLRSCLVRVGDGRSCFSLSLEGWHEGWQLLPCQSDHNLLCQIMI